MSPLLCLKMRFPSQLPLAERNRQMNFSRWNLNAICAKKLNWRKKKRSWSIDRGRERLKQWKSLNRNTLRNNEEARDSLWQSVLPCAKQSERWKKCLRREEKKARKTKRKRNPQEEELTRVLKYLRLLTKLQKQIARIRKRNGLTRKQERDTWPIGILL